MAVAAWTCRRKVTRTNAAAETESARNEDSLGDRDHDIRGPAAHGDCPGESVTQTVGLGSLLAGGPFGPGVSTTMTRTLTVLGTCLDRD